MKKIDLQFAVDEPIIDQATSSMKHEDVLHFAETQWSS
jgi:hypothetical protein